jgi:hypothetical protein
MRKIFLPILLSTIVFFGVTSLVLAQGTTGDGAGTSGNGQGSTGGGTGGGDTSIIDLSKINPLQCNDLECVILRIVDIVTKIAIPIVTAMVVGGGIKIVLAGANPKSAQEGREMIFNAAIGFAIILVANSVVLVIKSLLGAS